MQISLFILHSLKCLLSSNFPTYLDQLVYNKSVTARHCTLKIKSTYKKGFFEQEHTVRVNISIAP